MKDAYERGEIQFGGCLVYGDPREMPSWWCMAGSHGATAKPTEWERRRTPQSGRDRHGQKDVVRDPVERDASWLKLQFHGALDRNEFAEAEALVPRIQAPGSEEQWCQNARGQIGFVRRRRPGPPGVSATDGGAPRMSDELGEAGDLLVSVVLGPCLVDLLRIWTSEGEGRMVRVDQPEELRALLGRGELARTSREPGRFQEVGLFNPVRDTLHLLGRLRHPTPSLDQEGRLLEDLTIQAPIIASFTLKPTEEPFGLDQLWPAAAEWLGTVVVSAAKRGEFVVIEPKRWEARSRPYVRACAIRSGVGARRPPSWEPSSGIWGLQLHAAPAPAARSWPPPEGQPTAVTGWPISDSASLAAAGHLLAEAASSWAQTPFDMVLTYGPCPDGPWPGEGTAPHGSVGTAKTSDAQAAYELGSRLEQRGDLEGAEAAYRRADEAGHAAAACDLGILLYQRGDLVGAESAWRRADERGDAGAACNLALLLEQRGDLKGAEAAYRRGDERGIPGAACGVGRVLEQRGDVQAAEAAYRRDDVRGHAGAAYNLGVMLEQRGDVEGAEAAYRRADERGHADASADLGVLLHQRGDLEGAEAAFRRGDERGDPDGAHNLGVLLVERGDLDGAEAAFRRADEIGHPGAAYNLALLLEQRGDLEGAAAAYRQADERGHAKALNNLGLLLRRRSDLDGAEDAWRRADERGNAKAAFNLGLLLQERGDIEGARAAWSRAITRASDPRDEIAEHARAALRSLDEPGPAAPSPSSAPLATPPPPTAPPSQPAPAPPVRQALPTPTPDEVPSYKRRFASALDEERFDDAERLVAALEAVASEKQWCENALDQIRFRRQRT